jgi:hypothetical protein
MKTFVNRETVDLAEYPDLVVIYLGMKVTAFRGIKTLLGLGPQIDKEGAKQPEGLLHYENNIIFSLFPLHIGMRWYWKDFESMETWARSGKHKQWWIDFVKDSGGTAFWHETYTMNGGIEAIYDDVETPLGLKVFAPSVPAKGSLFSARGRTKLGGNAPATPEGVSEQDEY